MTSIAIVGATGRMGQRLIALTVDDPALTLAEAVDRPDHPHLGQTVPDADSPVRLAAELEGHAQAVIDFAAPVATRRTIAHCLEVGTPLVIGTTGLTAEDDALIDQASRSVPVLQASNFSLVVNVLHVLAAQAAKLLGDAYDIEVLEAHHRYKVDAPSGTALALARTLCDATGRDFDKDVRLERHGDDVPRKPNEITVQTLRIGDDPGEHTLYFAAPGERLELKHVSTSRDSYALGALHAAKWLVGKPAGRYTMQDVLGLR